MSDQQEQIYHACRVAFNCSNDGIPWYMTCHAIRQGLKLHDSMTYKLQEKDFKKYPQLRELVDYLQKT